MGVLETYCQTCAMQVQHDSYFPVDNMWGDYHGPNDQDSTKCDGPTFPFGPEQLDSVTGTAG
ncbi:MAG: hypothetical protein WBD20_21825 [Pirellulaceae bacterium]